MTCEKARRKFLEADNRARLPLSVTIHTIFCKRCAEEIRTLREHFDALRGDAPFEMDRDLCDAVMREISHVPPHSHHVGAISWAGAGILILAGMFLIPFSDTFSWLRIHFGRGIEIPMSIVLGTLFTVYALAAVFSNLDGIKKLVEDLPHHLPRWLR